ncbi:hypothetical protein SDC9_121691 [bioreactor metagenome]|uniref:Uncharacterized protein n=1 Tax=bioreactor metagenome TaxID=1076179 RepID=A0A645CCV1_9ZZZZ
MKKRRPHAHHPDEDESRAVTRRKGEQRRARDGEQRPPDGEPRTSEPVGEETEDRLSENIRNAEKRVQKPRLAHRQRNRLCQHRDDRRQRRRMHIVEAVEKDHSEQRAFVSLRNGAAIITGGGRIHKKSSNIHIYIKTIRYYTLCVKQWEE